jgi:hypothetical protein
VHRYEDGTDARTMGYCLSSTVSPQRSVKRKGIRSSQKTLSRRLVGHVSWVVRASQSNPVDFVKHGLFCILSWRRYSLPIGIQDVRVDFARANEINPMTPPSKSVPGKFNYGGEKSGNVLCNQDLTES